MPTEIDDKWFKAQQKRAGVTAEDIAQRMGRDRSTVSHIYTGRIRMSMDWAQAFADTLGVPLATIVEKAGIAGPAAARQLSPGFIDSDAVEWIPEGREDRMLQGVAEAFGSRSGAVPWMVKSNAMAGAGLLPGDFMLVDTHQAERVKAGDTVVAQVYARNGTAKMVLRRWMPPVLLTVSRSGDLSEVHVVDNENVVIWGKVVASWRVL